MNKGPHIASIVAVVLIVGTIVGFRAAGAEPQLGLDLRGGISAIYSPVVSEGEERPEDFDQVLDETITIIRQRVDSLGVAEPDISRQGDNVLVQLPGLDDPERARELIGTTAKLTFRPVIGVVSQSQTELYESLPECGTAVDPEELSQTLPQPVETPTEAPTGASTEEPTGTTETPAATETPATTETDVEGAAEETPTTAPTPDEQTVDEGQTGEDGTDVALVELPEDQSGVLCGTPDDAVEPGSGEGGPLQTKYIVGPSALTGDAIEDAFPSLSGGNTAGGWSVSLDLDGEGAQQFAAITSELACQRDQGQPGLLAIVLDNVVESAPAMNPGVACGEGITGGQAQITTGGTTADEAENEARDLALVLKTGALPITLEPSTFETISPTLGSESLRSGLMAGLIGLALVAIYLVFFYRWLGLVAIGALTVFGFVMTGLIIALGEIGFALTLAGIAGIVVSIGITADSSIIFFERIRDEVALGKTTRTAVKKAFDSAFRTNLAGNTVTLAAALILYFLAVGPVRGFALTLGIATVLDILILYFYSRPVVSLLSLKRGLLTKRSMRAPEAAPAGGGSS